MTIFLLLLIIVIVILVYLYLTRRISGRSLLFIIILTILFFIILLTAIGYTFAEILEKICMNEGCDIVRLPLDIRKIGEIDDTAYLYRIIPLNQSTSFNQTAPFNQTNWQ